jgi:hypothetical protein
MMHLSAMSRNSALPSLGCVTDVKALQIGSQKLSENKQNISFCGFSFKNL